MNIKQFTNIPKAVIIGAAIGTGAYCAGQVISESKKIETTTNNNTNPMNVPATAGTLFTLGLFGRKKNEEETETQTQEQFWKDVFKSMKEDDEKPKLSEEDKLRIDSEAAAKAGMSVEKYRSLFEATPKSNDIVISGFASHKPRYYNTAREWLFAWDENFNTDVKSVQKGLNLMNSCFEQYEKENIKIFEDEDKSRCKQLMAEVNDAIEKGEDIEDDKLSELVFIYDKKRLYPYI